MDWEGRNEKKRWITGFNAYSTRKVEFLAVYEESKRTRNKK